MRLSNVRETRDLHGISDSWHVICVLYPKTNTWPHCCLCLCSRDLLGTYISNSNKKKPSPPQVLQQEEMPLQKKNKKKFFLLGSCLLCPSHYQKLVEPSLHHHDMISSLGHVLHTPLYRMKNGKNMITILV